MTSITTAFFQCSATRNFASPNTPAPSDLLARYCGLWYQSPSSPATEGTTMMPVDASTRRSVSSASSSIGNTSTRARNASASMPLASTEHNMLSSWSMCPEFTVITPTVCLGPPLASPLARASSGLSISCRSALFSLKAAMPRSAMAAWPSFQVSNSSFGSPPYSIACFLAPVGGTRRSATRFISNSACSRSDGIGNSAYCCMAR
mmetsp:Transcript_8118/g.32893  ORF Transcript_8118/g.32893 Transcript_8118/m.32893 type:complete len:205 (+) Transcript_8118:1656-2270(+)